MSIQSKSFNNTLRQFEELLHLGKYSVKKKNLEKKGDRDEKDGREHEDEANTSRNRMLISKVDRGVNSRKRRLANDSEDATTYAAGKTSSYLKEASDTDSEEEEEEEDIESHESDSEDRKKRGMSCKKQRFTNMTVNKSEETLIVSHKADVSLTASDVGEAKASNLRLSFGSKVHVIAETTNGREKKMSGTEDCNDDEEEEGKEEGREECDDEEEEEDEDEGDEDEEYEDEDDVEEMEIYKRAISCLSRSRNGISQSGEKNLKNKPIHAVNRSNTSKPERSGRMSGAPTKHPWMKI
eukprot:CAMPEP_0175070628 /NCGR_PEP_ID=MMETSP0052_2-20121109/18816_1 /TAXON_ID=51329 ORGANISM="Polytomella parva, Strain SAG 63-3" /NCGR_SAMPLE_ID=MMETSP0052_2 /ASSEMBLY_ACC=CAM_ASM_000194 /LENGTH=295 /DNA_ID=CAMNT_0016337755 /DNA_START=498 /DNA_END=1385 /DNA_ORIENTATION=+